MRRRLCAAILTLEAVVLGLTTPVLISVLDVDTTASLVLGLGLVVVCLLTAGMLRMEWAYYVGWGIQVAAVLLGFLIAPMFALGIIFGALWLTAYRLGGTIDRDRAQAASGEPGPTAAG